jgi:hypothetical protein
VKDRARKEASQHKDESAGVSKDEENSVVNGGRNGKKRDRGDVDKDEV